MMATRVLVSMLLLAATSAVAQTVEHIEIKGAHALITVPEPWNGSLFLYAHGYTSDERSLAPIPDEIGQATPVLWPGLLGLVPDGYAWAITTFRSTGWDVKDAIKDVENLRRYFAKKYGKQTEMWHGIDLTMNVRPQGGLFFGGGLSTGRLTTDNCEIVAKLPETTPLTPAAFCHVQEPWLTQFKAIASYIVPKVDVQVSGTLQSVPGPPLQANFVVTNAVASPSLGRALSGGAANVTVPILSPTEMYGDRRNQIDMRLAKVFRLDRMRLTAGIDIANLTNASPVLTQSAAYATWLRPQSILTARFAKLSVQLNF